MMALALLSAPAAAATLKLAVASDASFTIEFDGTLWLSGAEVALAALSSRAGTLFPLGAPRAGSGRDALGAFDSTAVEWGERSSNRTLMRTTFRTYPSDPATIVFEQYFPSEVNLSAARLSLSAATVFPGFARNPGPADGLRCFAYHSLFPQMKSCTVADYAESHQGGAPLAIYNASDARLPAVVFSPLNQPKAAHFASAAGLFGAGVKATAHSIPAGWRQQFLLTAAYGINRAMMAWGERMLKHAGKPRPSLYLDVTHSTIGFWTDNGGYYHYSTGNASESYEEVLPRVKAYHEAEGVPFRHWQFDSWFYPKDGAVSPGGGGGAVTNWTAMPSVFPSGMAGIQKLLRMPMVMHNRQWSSQSDYIKREKFKWYTSECCAVPQDPPAFFAWFFTQQQGWGLTMYEQDWMNKEYDGVAALQTNLSLADLWLAGMASGAASSNRTVQYCMPYAHDILSGAAHAAVTNARATSDYFHAPHQWAIGGTALFYWSLGIIPFKDGFYSSTRRQVGGQTVGPETNPDREILMAVLSGAMVAPMDGIGLLNATRVLASCRADGYVLKPDRPLSPPDVCFTRQAPEDCFVYTTYSDVQGLGRVAYVFMNTPEPLTAALAMLPPSASADHAVYNWYTGTLSPLRASSSVLQPGYEGHSYAVVYPVVEGAIFLGERHKYVTASTLRFTNVSMGARRVSATVVGIQGENVTLCAASTSDWIVRCSVVAFDASGAREVDLL
ncbi:hypothetical protein AB1Y20_005904 [Prymnesium parvum]|uniref:Uncharacterized protein n=1 Tax=Prymnesium parvum TaxID=97485 RepID=A0AB34J1Q1_PRYPA